MSRSWRTGAVAAIAVVAVGGTAAAAVGFGGDSGGTEQRGATPPATTPVTRATLVDQEDVDGELDYGTTTPLRADGPGIVTRLPAVGSTVERGGRLLDVNNEPVILLYGALPAYRPLNVGVEGPDVKQFEENLRALGYRGFTVDNEFTSSTASAVKEWQEKLGVAETGTVTSGQIRYAGGAIRVAEHGARVGDPCNGEVLTYTGTVRLVTVDLPVEDRSMAPVGAAVTVLLPAGATAAGKVTSVGAVASAEEESQQGPQGESDPTVEVLVSVTDQKALGDLQQAPVKVRFVAAERKDVLTVPVAALVALAEGGYGVQLVEGSTTRYVAVTTGMFAGGRVEVEGPDLQPGVLVGIPK
jgi:peptidoglycan hydrolase-like protein with peptidoglycan-binding domain